VPVFHGNPSKTRRGETLAFNGKAENRQGRVQRPGVHYYCGVSDRRRAQVVEKRPKSLADRRKRLSAVGRVQRCRSEGPLPQMWPRFDDLIPRETLPLAEIELAQPRVPANFETVRFRDDRRGLNGANEIACVDGVEAFAAQAAGEQARLRASFFGERDVGDALEPARSVPIRGAVPDQR
jgi:hypothetical protein